MMELIILIALLALSYFFIRKKRRENIFENSIHSLMKDSFQMMEEKRKKIEAKGLSYIHHDLNEGISQMVDFPYNTYEDWEAAYTKAAIEANPALAPTVQDNGKKISLMDFLDDEPCRMAYNQHLNPEILGKRFGETFDPLDVPFEDGSTTRDLLRDKK